MTPARRWLRNRVEKWLGRYREGPQPPERLTQLVEQFVILYPHATKAEWATFAIQLAEESYRSGYTRGYEYVERVPELWRPDIPPEMLADMHDPDWRWTPMDRGIEFAQDVVPDENDDVTRVLNEIKRVRAWVKAKM